MTEFPDAEYVILSSRLIPDMDGGYTLATLARARQMAAAGVHEGRGPLLLTVDPGSARDHARHRAAFDGRDLIVAAERMRNLFDEAAEPGGGAASWLREAVRAGARDPALEYRTVTDGEGRAVVSLPVISGDPDWHISTAPVVVHDASGGEVGVLDGFGALYRAWLAHVVANLRAASPARAVVVICESRQLGELLAGWDDPDVRLLHTIHTVHLEPPYTPDAPVNALWARWFTLAERFDAVLWPTHAQRADVAERFGGSGVHVVVPHGVPAAASVRPGSERVPGRVIMLNRLAAGKRVDHAVRAFPRVVERVPDAHLDVYGDGPERERLQALIDELGLVAHVVLRGPTDDPGRALRAASAYLSTSAYEGQGLSIVEALADGCPVVSYDAPYGPRELLGRGGGLLVPDGDIDALADAIVRVLADPELHHRLAVEGAQSARAVDPEHAMAALARAARDVLSVPSRRGGVE
ncbi:glycosyltransferase [Microbacterium sp. NPDC055910]|uniref:glycosyltransferase n=1 Tax=Microbacterium sp. NPDC055910 TaxID=3345659 RepID=UPI0035D56769